MKKARLNNSKKLKDKEEIVGNQMMSAKGIVITLCSMIVIFVAFYFLTSYLLNNIPKERVLNGFSTDTTKIDFNDIYKQDDESYYVLAILEDDENESKYEKYLEISNISPVYYIDMSNSFNKNHVGEETVVSEKVKDILISDTTLFEVKDGKIESYYVGHDEIKEYTISQNSEENL